MDQIDRSFTLRLWKLRLLGLFSRNGWQRRSSFEYGCPSLKERWMWWQVKDRKFRARLRQSRRRIWRWGAESRARYETQNLIGSS